MQWPLADIADRLQQALTAAEAAVRLEQAVYGIDSLDELAMHRLLVEKLSASYDLAREVHYPSSAGRKLSHRQRCDLVLTPKGLPLRLDSAPPSLFDPVNVCPPEDALWVEVKLAYQFRSGGVPHRGYGAQWRQAVVDDLRKMEAEPRIKEAALLLIVFTESQAIVDKDVELFEDVLVKREVLAGFRQLRSVPIWDRIGHSICTAVLWPTIQRD